MRNCNLVPFKTYFDALIKRSKIKTYMLEHAIISVKTEMYHVRVCQVIKVPINFPIFPFYWRSEVSSDSCSHAENQENKRAERKNHRRCYCRVRWEIGAFSPTEKLVRNEIAFKRTSNEHRAIENRYLYQLLFLFCCRCNLYMYNSNKRYITNFI